MQLLILDDLLEQINVILQLKDESFLLVTPPLSLLLAVSDNVLPALAAHKILPRTSCVLRSLAGYTLTLVVVIRLQRLQESFTSRFVPEGPVS